MSSNQMPDIFSKVDAMRQKSAEREAARAEAARRQAEENRRRMPEITSFVDSMRAFFPDAKVAYACEGGVTLGQPSPAGVKLSETLVGPFARVKK